MAGRSPWNYLGNIAPFPIDFYFPVSSGPLNILISYFRIPLNQTNMKKIFTLMLLSGMFLAAQAQTAQEPTAEEKAWMAYMTPDAQNAGGCRW